MFQIIPYKKYLVCDINQSQSLDLGDLTVSSNFISLIIQNVLIQ